MHPQQDFIVIDTEGKNELREIAIIDSQGKLIYEAFAKEHPDNYEKVLNLKPLREIVVDFLEIAKTKLIIFHLRVFKKWCDFLGDGLSLRLSPIFTAVECGRYLRCDCLGH
jgi:hypothetical protein